MRNEVGISQDSQAAKTTRVIPEWLGFGKVSQFHFVRHSGRPDLRVTLISYAPMPMHLTHNPIDDSHRFDSQIVNAPIVHREISKAAFKNGHY